MLEILEIILDKKILFVMLGAMTVIGVLSKLVVNVVLKRLVHAASNMGRSNHSLMRLVRAKFEHACMVSDRVGNVRVFVDKYLYEYKVLGMRLHSWRRLEKATAGMCILIGAAGAAAVYMAYGMQEMVLRLGATGAVLAILIYLFHLTTDEGYRLEAAQNYMVDYLENICLHKYEKSTQKELKVMAPEVPIADFGVVSEKAIREEERELHEEQFAAEQIEPEKIEPEKIQPEKIQPEKIQPEKIQTAKARMERVLQKEEPAVLREEPIQEVKLQDISIPELAPKVVISPVKQMKQAAVQEDKQEKKPKEDVKKDVLIRQILEEFMA